MFNEILKNKKRLKKQTKELLLFRIKKSQTNYFKTSIFHFDLVSFSFSIFSLGFDSSAFFVTKMVPFELSATPFPTPVKLAASPSFLSG